jgi:hypothetical protein
MWQNGDKDLALTRLDHAYPLAGALAARAAGSPAAGLFGGDAARARGKLGARGDRRARRRRATSELARYDTAMLLGALGAVPDSGVECRVCAHVPDSPLSPQYLLITDAAGAWCRNRVRVPMNKLPSAARGEPGLHVRSGK